MTVCGYVFPVDAGEYLRELGQIAMLSNGSYTYPKRYCPRCEAKANHLGYESEREMDERIKKLESE
tara:strand:- start:11413 stop:11610 length:198 start_codon:yes stop_codon:yes gene_type:complete